METEAYEEPRYDWHALAAGFLSITCFAVLACFPLSEVVITVICYFMLACTVVSVWCGYHVLFISPISARRACFQFVVLATFPFVACVLELSLLLANEVRYQYAAQVCWDHQRREAITLITEQTMPSSIRNIAGKLPKCNTYRRFPPWLPAMRKPLGVNRHLAGKNLGKLPHPERTVLFADCLSPDGLINGPEDIDWNRHGEGHCTITLCDGRRWNWRGDPGELIFKPK